MAANRSVSGAVPAHTGTSGSNVAQPSTAKSTHVSGSAASRPASRGATGASTAAASGGVPDDPPPPQAVRHKTTANRRTSRLYHSTEFGAPGVAAPRALGAAL